MSPEATARPVSTEGSQARLVSQAWNSEEGQVGFLIYICICICVLLYLYLCNCICVFVAGLVVQEEASRKLIPSPESPLKGSLCFSVSPEYYTTEILHLVKS